MKKNALLIGATGLVGSYCLLALLENSRYANVRVIVRRLIDITDPKLEQIVCPDFSNLEKFESAFEVEDVFCCVGTTIKKAKSKAAFRAVDFDIPVIAAQLSAKRNAGSFSLVSAIGADEKSRNFYLKTKGEMEGAVTLSAIPTLHIFRPSLIIGDRKEHRNGEKLALILMPFFNKLMLGGLQKYKSIHAQEIAQSMINALKDPMQETKVYTFKEMKALI